MNRRLTRFIVIGLFLASIALPACSSEDRQADTSPPTEAVPEQSTPAPTDAAVATVDNEPVVSTSTVVPDPPAEPAAAKSEQSDATAVDDDEGLVSRFVIVPDETIAGYSINEVFLSDNNVMATAVGVTSEVEGSMTLHYDDPSASEFEQFVVDISTLKSDRSRRDRAIRAMWLESSTFPLATFDVSEVQNFPVSPEEGVPIAFELAGDMTVKETTRQVVWDVTATLEDDRLTGTATLDTLLEDFNIPVPSIAGVLRVTDGITLTVDFVMERADG